VTASLADGEPIEVKKQIVQLATGCRYSFEWLQLEATRQSLREGPTAKVCTSLMAKPKPTSIEIKDRCKNVELR